MGVSESFHLKDQADATLVASEALTRWDLVHITAGGATTVDQNDATDVPQGVAARDAASGGEVPVIMLEDGAFIEMRSAGAIAKGAIVNTKNGGEIDDDQAVGTFDVGIAMQAAGGANEIITVLVQRNLVAN